MLPNEPVFEIENEEQFRALALKTFHYQYEHNQVYREYADLQHVRPDEVKTPEEIPFLPIRLFKTRDVICGTYPPHGIFLSSGTTGMTRSRHLVADLDLYRRSFVSGFHRFFGDPANMQFLALSPPPDQAPDSSLVFMINGLMDLSASPENGFFLTNHSGLHTRLQQKRQAGKRIMLIGLTWALLDFIRDHPGDYSPLIVVETGGMKGRRGEMVREELHALLCRGFGVETIHSEYGMTELLSQAWSHADGLFATPPWMKVMIRDASDPLAWAPAGTTGGISIIDLANRHSCSFIATEDLGKMHPDGRFEVLGRFDAADLRGCSLML